MMTDIFILGLNHKSAPISAREKYVFDPDKQLDILNIIKEFVNEAVLLSTCNRTELIYTTQGENQHSKIKETFCSHGQLTQEETEDFFYFHKKRPALIHLFRVASVLDSLVVGETQILGQIKDAFTLSANAGFSANQLNCVYQHMLNASKKIRRDTKIGAGSTSVGSVAVQLACNIFSSLTDKTVTLVGAGKICELAGNHFADQCIKKIYVVNRSIDRARKLAKKFTGEAYPLPELETIMRKTDIILTSVSDQPAMITKDMIENVMQSRGSKPLFLIDIAMPRNIDQEVNQLPDAYLYNIDDLKQLADENLHEREKEAKKAEEIVLEKVEKMRNNGEIAGPLIQSLHKRVSLIKENELQRLYRKNAALSDTDRTHIEQSVNQIVNKILHDPIISLRQGLNEDHEAQHKLLNLFKRFFNL